jgi:hypothetical protein
MYNDQDRPPWLRGLRPARPEPEPEIEAAAPTVAEPVAEPGTVGAPAETDTEVQGALSRQQLLLLAILLWGNITILGCLCLMATGTVVP